MVFDGTRIGKPISLFQLPPVSPMTLPLSLTNAYI